MLENSGHSFWARERRQTITDDIILPLLKSSIRWGLEVWLGGRMPSLALAKPVSSSAPKNAVWEQTLELQVDESSSAASASSH